MANEETQQSSRVEVFVYKKGNAFSFSNPNIKMYSSLCTHVPFASYTFDAQGEAFSRLF